MKYRIYLFIIILLTVSCNIITPIDKSEFEQTKTENKFSSLVSECKSIDDRLSQKECIIKIAKQYGEVAICNEIQSTYDRDGCISMVTLETKDYSNCDLIEEAIDSKNYCYFVAGRELLDVNYCHKITKGERHGFDGGCYESVAIAEQDSKVCDMIEAGGGYNANSKYNCYKIVELLINSSDSNDSNICANTENENIKRLCYETFNE